LGFFGETGAKTWCLIPQQELLCTWLNPPHVLDQRIITISDFNSPGKKGIVCCNIDLHTATEPRIPTAPGQLHTMWYGARRIELAKSRKVSLSGHSTSWGSAPLTLAVSIE
jgi:hypothetical protein